MRERERGRKEGEKVLSRIERENHGKRKGEGEGGRVRKRSLKATKKLVAENSPQSMTWRSDLIKRIKKPTINPRVHSTLPPFSSFLLLLSSLSSLSL